MEFIITVDVQRDYDLDRSLNKVPSLKSVRFSERLDT